MFFAPGVLLLPGPQWRELGNTCRYVHLYTYTLIVCVYLPSVYQPLHLPTHLHTYLRQNHEFTEIASISVRRHRFIFIFFLYLWLPFPKVRNLAAHNLQYIYFLGQFLLYGIISCCCYCPTTTMETPSLPLWGSTPCDESSSPTSIWTPRCLAQAPTLWVRLPPFPCYLPNYIFFGFFNLKYIIFIV